MEPVTSDYENVLHRSVKPNKQFSQLNFRIDIKIGPFSKSFDLMKDP